MSCNGVTSDFDRLFAQRFNELESLISSSPSSAAGPMRQASACVPCASMKMPGGANQGGFLQMLVFVMLTLGIVLLLVSVLRKLRKQKPMKSIYGAMVLPSVGGAGGTVPAMPRAMTGEVKMPEASEGQQNGIKVIVDPKLIMPSSSVKPQLTMFFADWCGHCTKMKPLFGEAARMNPDCDFALVENTVLQKHPDAKSFNVQGFPMIIGFLGSKKLGELVGFVPKEKLLEFVAKLKRAAKS